jgi:hypothetical protein
MKWVSNLSLMVAGTMLAAIASRPVAAYPLIRMGGPEAVLTALAGECDIEAFLALLANPSAGADDPALRLNALKAMSLGGLGGIGDLTACQADALNGVALALNDEISSHDAMLLQGESAEDMIAALLGVPMTGVDGLPAIDQAAAGSEADSDLALALVDELNLPDALAKLQDTEITSDGITSDNTNLASSFDGAGGGGGLGGALSNITGGAWYGGTKNRSAGGNVGGTSGGGHHTAGNSHKSKHHTATPAIVPGGNPPTTVTQAPGYNGQINSGDVGVVPLPSASWGGLILIGLLGATRKTRLARAILA